MTIDVSAKDLPKELAEIRQHLRKFRASQAQVEFKNEALSRLVKNTKITLKENNAALEQSAEQEIAEWTKLADRFAAELGRYEMMCYFCGAVFSLKTVHERCKQNNIPVLSETCNILP